MSSSCVLAVVVHDADEAITREATAKGETSAFRGREDFLRNFELQRISNFFPNLLSSSCIVVLKALQMKDEDWRKSFNEHLLRRRCSRPSRRIEIAVQSLGSSQSFESIGDVMNVRSLDVQLQRLIRFESDGILEPRYP